MTAVASREHQRAREEGRSPMPMGEHISTLHQGRFMYEIFVSESGRHWAWEVDRTPNVLKMIVRVPAVAEGRVRTRDEAIAAAQAARQEMMERNRKVDGIAS